MLIEMADATIRAEMGVEHIDAVAHSETVGIPFTAWLADRLNVPMQYVHKKTKGVAETHKLKVPWKKGCGFYGAKV